MNFFFFVEKCYETWHPWKDGEKTNKLFVLMEIEYYKMSESFH